MGIIRFLKDLSRIHKLYEEDLKKQATRDKIIANGITEEFIREAIRQADTGVVLEVAFPNGTIFRSTRTLVGANNELIQGSNGMSFKESF